MDLNTWQALLLALDPWRSLSPEEVGTLYVDRPDSPARRLAARLRMSHTAPGQASDFKIVVCGARGSGKSTELARLAWEVRDDFVPVSVDVGAALPEGTGTLTVLALLGAGLERAAVLWTNPDLEPDAPVPSTKKTQGRVALRDAMKAVGVVSTAVDQLVSLAGPVLSITVPGAGSVLGAAGQAARASSAALGKLRAHLGKANLTPAVGPDELDKARALVDAVNTLADELENLSGRPILVIAEGLDKRTEVADVATVLRDVDLLRGLRAPVALSGPINLRHDPRFSGAAGAFSLAMLHNVPVVDRHDAERPEGVALLQELWEKRRAQASLPAGALTAEALAHASISSTGLMRDFLTLLRDAAVLAFERRAERIEHVDVEAAVRHERLKVQGYLNDSRIALLQRVAEKGTLPASPEADVLLYQNIIVAHANGELWFRPHAVLTAWLASLRIMSPVPSPDDA